MKKFLFLLLVGVAFTTTVAAQQPTAEQTKRSIIDQIKSLNARTQSEACATLGKLVFNTFVGNNYALYFEFSDGLGVYAFQPSKAYPVKPDFTNIKYVINNLKLAKGKRIVRATVYKYKPDGEHYLDESRQIVFTEKVTAAESAEFHRLFAKAAKVCGPINADNIKTESHFIEDFVAQLSDKDIAAFKTGVIQMFNELF